MLARRRPAASSLRSVSAKTFPLLDGHVLDDQRLVGGTGSSIACAADQPAACRGGQGSQRSETRARKELPKVQAKRGVCCNVPTAEPVRGEDHRRIAAAGMPAAAVWRRHAAAVRRRLSRRLPRHRAAASGWLRVRPSRRLQARGGRSRVRCAACLLRTRRCNPVPLCTDPPPEHARSERGPAPSTRAALPCVRIACAILTRI